MDKVVMLIGLVVVSLSAILSMGLTLVSVAKYRVCCAPIGFRALGLVARLGAVGIGIFLVGMVI